jgi:sporulation protein YlmC with PRC-barrel domain
MLQLSATLINKNILSLRTGEVIASVTAAIFNPNNLKVEGFYCQDKFSKKELILVYQDIRDIVPKGYVVNDFDVLVEAEDLVRLKDVLELNYQILGKTVQTTSKKKVGKVVDYATEMETMFVQKIYVGQSIIKSFNGGSLSIDRSQVNEITPSKIIINDLLEGSAVRASAAAA